MDFVIVLATMIVQSMMDIVYSCSDRYLILDLGSMVIQRLGLATVDDSSHLWVAIDKPDEWATVFSSTFFNHRMCISMNSNVIDEFHKKII